MATWEAGRIYHDPRNPRVPKASFGSLFSSWKTSWQIRQCQKLVQVGVSQQIMSTPSKSKPWKKRSSFWWLSTAKKDVENIPAGPLSGLVLPLYYGLQHSFFIYKLLQYVLRLFSFLVPLQWFQFKIHECSENLIWTWKWWSIPKLNMLVWKWCMLVNPKMTTKSIKDIHSTCLSFVLWSKRCFTYECVRLADSSVECAGLSRWSLRLYIC